MERNVIITRLAVRRLCPAEERRVWASTKDTIPTFPEQMDKPHKKQIYPLIRAPKRFSAFLSYLLADVNLRELDKKSKHYYYVSKY